MNVHLEELALAQAFDGTRSFEDLTDQQMHAIRERGRALYKWFKAHPRTHNFINSVVILSLLVGDGFAMLGLPRLFLTAAGSNDLDWILIAALASGCVHGWLMYSMTVLSLHEGAAHNLIIVGTGPVARLGQFLTRNLCRLHAADPDYYSASHMAHHAKFGTAHDAEFLNFVIPRRFWMAFIPLAAFINFTDFVVHRPLVYTRSRVTSAVLSVLYHGLYAYFAYRSFGLVFALLMTLIATHLGFYVDRLRQFTEHNLMRLENQNGARNLGIGFWGMFIGGGPWGQPCHLSHHLVPSIPWYQQLLLHRSISGMLTERQREQFRIAPIIGFPRLLFAVVRDANRFVRTTEAGK